MTAHTTFAPAIAIAANAEEKHRKLMTAILIIALGALTALAIYGESYYRLSQADRPTSAKHYLLKPGGVLGINLGLLGVLLLCGIFLYPLRKRWAWLRRQGNSKHWLDHHVVLGVVAPVCIAFHASFKFHGLAGIAFWVMVAVSVSGFVGRYLYAQVLVQVAAAEFSLREFQAALERQRIVSQADLRRLLLHLPAANRVSHWSALTAVIYMVACDLARPFRIARLRMKVTGIEATLQSLSGFPSAQNAQFERVIVLARKQALLSRRLLFLSHAQRVFRLWHVLHRPFSYAFAVLALLHIVVAMLLGFV